MFFISAALMSELFQNLPILFFLLIYFYTPLKKKKELYITIIQKQLKSGVFYFGYEYILAKYYIFIYFYMINTLQFIV